MFVQVEFSTAPWMAKRKGDEEAGRVRVNIPAASVTPGRTMIGQFGLRSIDCNIGKGQVAAGSGTAPGTHGQLGEISRMQGEFGVEVIW
jgi:hypothetical protein